MQILFCSILAACCSNFAFAAVTPIPKTHTVRMIEIYDGHSNSTSTLSLIGSYEGLYELQSATSYVSGVEVISSLSNEEQHRLITSSVVSGLMVSIKNIKDHIFNIDISYQSEPKFKTTKIHDVDIKTPMQNLYKLTTSVKIGNDQLCLPISGKERNKSVCFKEL